MPYGDRTLSSIEYERQQELARSRRRESYILKNYRKTYPQLEGFWQGYVGPNGGKRILPSGYTTLTTAWIRSNGTAMLPSEMNDGHLENTIKLLHESYGNLQAKAQEMLGKMRAHFRNAKRVPEGLEAMCLEMQSIEIDEVYPVFIALSEELAKRHERLNNKLLMRGIDEDQLSEWMDTKDW